MRFARYKCTYTAKTFHNVIVDILPQLVSWVKTKNSWLYSASTEETIIIQCKDYPEVKRTIKNTGKIVLEDSRKVITNNAIIKAETDL